MTKHLLLILVLIVGSCFGSFAQDKKGKRGEDMAKELREFKIKFIAQEIDLKDDQKTAFVELYNEMSNQRDEVMRNAWRMERQLKKNKNATEADYQAVSDAMTRAKAKDVEIEKSYDAKFAKILSQKQIFKMKEAENSFRKKIDEMRQKRKKRDDN